MDGQPQAATYEELTARCGHECLSKPDHLGPHFYGYIGGPYSYAGLLSRVAELEASLKAQVSINVRNITRMFELEAGIRRHRDAFEHPYLGYRLGDARRELHALLDSEEDT